SQPLALAAMGRHPQALLAPEPLDGLAVHLPALLQELGVGAPVAPAGMGPAEPAQRLAEGAVPIGLDRPKTLGAAGLPDQLARPPLRHPKHLLEVGDGAAPAGRAHQVPPPTPFNAPICRFFSATIPFRGGSPPPT